MLNTLCAVAWQAVAMDAIVLILMVVLGVKDGKKGFVACVFSVLSTVVSLILAFSLMKPMLGWTDGFWGLQGVLQDSVTTVFGKIKGLNIDVSNQGLETALTNINLPKFLVNMVVDEFGNASLPVGTTVGALLGQSLGELIAGVISWIVIYLLSKYVVFFIFKKVLTKLLDKIPVVGKANHVIGFVVGALKGLLIVSAIFAVIALIPSTAIGTFFSKCWFVGLLYNHNPLHVILGWILV